MFRVLNVGAIISSSFYYGVTALAGLAMGPDLGPIRSGNCRPYYNVFAQLWLGGFVGAL